MFGHERPPIIGPKDNDRGFNLPTNGEPRRRDDAIISGSRHPDVYLPLPSGAAELIRV